LPKITYFKSTLLGGIILF